MGARWARARSAAPRGEPARRAGRWARGPGQPAGRRAASLRSAPATRHHGVVAAEARTTHGGEVVESLQPPQHLCATHRLQRQVGGWASSEALEGRQCYKRGEGILPSLLLPPIPAPPAAVGGPLSPAGRHRHGHQTPTWASRVMKGRAGSRHGGVGAGAGLLESTGWHPGP